MNTLLIVILILLLLGVVGSAPVWPHAANWGPYPASGIGTVLLVLLLLWLFGVLR